MISLTPISASTAMSLPAFLQVEGAKEIAVEIYSMSKSFNMAGWRVGFCLGNKKMIGALARIKSYLDYGVFQPIQIASIIALRECAKDTEKIRASIRSAAICSSPVSIARAGRWNRRKRHHVRLGADSGEVSRQRIARILEAADGKSAGCRIAGHRIRAAGRRPRALRSHREPAPDAAGH
jgi:hypothetical protein